MQLERILGLVLGIFMGHLALESVDAAFDPSWIISAIPAAPQTLFSLVEAHYDGFENATVTQLRPVFDFRGCQQGSAQCLPAPDTVLLEFPTMKQGTNPDCSCLLQA